MSDILSHVPGPQFTFRKHATTLPLSPMDFVEFYKQKSEDQIPVFTVALADSLQRMKTYPAILRFINNSKMVVRFDRLPADLLHSYMNLNVNLIAPDLMEAHANVLHFFKFGEVLFEHSAMTAKRCKKFISRYRKSVVRQCQFLDSMILFLMASRSKVDEPITGFDKNTIEDTQARESHRTDYLDTHRVDAGIYDDLGLPLLRMLSLPDFVTEWYTDGMPFEQQILFTRHFDESMYEGKPLFAYVGSSLLMGILRLPAMAVEHAGHFDLLLRRDQAEHPELNFSALGAFAEHRSQQSESIEYGQALGE